MTDALPITVANFNNYLAGKKLMAAHCNACGATFVPPRAICAACHSEDMTWVEMSGKGKLAAFTSINIGSTQMIEEGFDRDNPYWTGIVELEEGPKVSARLSGFSEPSPDLIGTPVTVDFVERGDKTYLGFKAAS